LTFQKWKVAIVCGKKAEVYFFKRLILNISILQEGESVGLIPGRGERLFNLHHYWFFATREGAAIGPYDSKEQTKQGVQDYIEFADDTDISTMKFFTQGSNFGA
jgi:hypothetical protein